MDVMDKQVVILFIIVFIVITFSVFGASNFIENLHFGGDSANASDNTGMKIILTNDGIFPDVVTIKSGGRAVFQNSDTQPHSIGLEKNGDASICAGLANVIIQSGRYYSNTFHDKGICRFFDRSGSATAGFRGEIIVK
ncbi:MAG: hypothetical protein CEN90_84 [Parcubacteria group bacterium Licking1014_17]|nr:MAG: hypothetical protein CEN90_84 [Parcubacteria group bacterium Licking1014_17]